MLRIDLHRGRGDRQLDLEEDDHIMCTRCVCSLVLQGATWARAKSSHADDGVL